ncbi:hypothetical protein HispidOSU_009729 [Sigmodon hispidus]
MLKTHLKRVRRGLGARSSRARLPDVPPSQTEGGVKGLTGSPASAVTSDTRRVARKANREEGMNCAGLRLRAKARLPWVVGDGRQARRPALAERRRCGECVLAPAPVPGKGVRQLLVIRRTNPVHEGVGQPHTTGVQLGPGLLVSRVALLRLPKEFDVVCPSQRVALTSSPFSWTLEP